MKTASRLPQINPLIMLSRAPPHTDGAPSWTLHNPASNEYFRINWAEFECLARFSQHTTIASLAEAVNRETTLHISERDIEGLIEFLNNHGLLRLSDQHVRIRKPIHQSLWKKLLHGYLFFTIPLVRPDNFLQETFPFVRPFLTRRFVCFMLFILGIGIIFTLKRADEFFHTFMQIFSPAGIVMGLLVFAGLKIFHEMAHAYTAVKYGVRVPHMGIAFMVLYPVLYTETTGSWQLSSRKQRMHIGMAGILAELCLAGLFLLLWHMSAAGSVMQSVAFTTVAISLIGSLLINLNPLMRFDGYYMLSDITGIDNLQTRACTFARWTIRRFLFGLKHTAPEPLPQRQQRFLSWFGLALLIYRFFLFIGIALLVYMIFPKPLGLFLMAVELLWFVGLPIWSELRAWWMLRTEIFASRRAFITAGLGATLIISALLPWQRTITLPAMAHAAQYAALYPITDAYIEDILVSEGQNVTEGQPLALLSSDALTKDIEKASQTLRNLQEFRRRVQADPTQARTSISDIDAQIALQKQEEYNLHLQRAQLIINAPFAGQIRDFNAELHKGRYIQKTDLLFRLINTEGIEITAYVEEQDLSRISTDTPGIFIPDHAPLSPFPLKIKTIDSTNVLALPWPALASVYGGPLATQGGAQPNGDVPPITPVQSLYGVHMLPLNGDYPVEINEISITGSVHIEGRAQSAISRLLRPLLALFWRESGLN